MLGHVRPISQLVAAKRLAVFVTAGGRSWPAASLSAVRRFGRYQMNSGLVLDIVNRALLTRKRHYAYGVGLTFAATCRSKHLET
jgi:hypothetical protein